MIELLKRLLVDIAWYAGKKFLDGFREKHGDVSNELKKEKSEP